MTNELFKNYWGQVNFSCFYCLLCVILILIFSILFFLKRLPLKMWLISVISLGLVIIFVVFKLVIPSAKDYKYVEEGRYIEIYGRMIEYTKQRDSDGTIIYSNPKFLIVGTDEYIVLPSCTGVEVGKTYKIQYLPNTKISVIVYTYD